MADEKEIQAREDRVATLEHDLECQAIEAVTEFFKGTATLKFHCIDGASLANGFAMRVERAKPDGAVQPK